MSPSAHSSPLPLIAVLLGLGAFATLVTWCVALLLVSEPRSTHFWTGVQFLTLIEFVGTALAVNTMARSRTTYRPSGAALAIVFFTVALTGAVGSATILVTSRVEPETGATTSILLGLLLLEVGVSFIAAALIYAIDLHFQAMGHGAKARRQEHGRLAKTLHGILQAFGEARLEDPALGLRRLALIKRLQSVEAALVHSHGGGLGSWESPPADSHLLDAAGEVRSVLQRMEAAVHTLSSPTSAAAASVVSECETDVARLVALVDAEELA